MDADDVLIIDGLTKNHRYPGWRLGWIVGPADTIEIIDRLGAVMDGGPSQIVQRAALAAMAPQQLGRETAAVRVEFTRKRNRAVAALRGMGLRVDPAPAGTFYVWASVADLPAPLNDGMEFFHRALAHRVMTVPGHLFDIDPGRQRTGPSPYTPWLRFSFGPTFELVAAGLDRLATMVSS